LDVIGVQIRRGDYIGHPKYVNLEKDYFEKGIKLIQKKYGKKSVYVFSDDIPWCRENFPYPVIDKPDYLVWEILRGCKYKVISNSTFSWWAAYVSDGITVAPSRWFNKENRQIVFEKTMKLDWHEI